MPTLTSQKCCKAYIKHVNLIFIKTSCIAHSFPTQEVFVVDPATGNVTVTKSLDRTVATEVTLAVTVTDVSATPPQVCKCVFVCVGEYM